MITQISAACAAALCNERMWWKRSGRYEIFVVQSLCYAALMRAYAAARGWRARKARYMYAGRRTNLERESEAIT